MRRSETRPYCPPFILWGDLMLYTVLFVVCLIWFYRWLNPLHPYVINVYFGVPGSGKTTFAAWLVRWCNKEAWPVTLGYWLMYHWPYHRFPCNPLAHWILEGRYWKRRIDVYSNVPITGSYQLDARSDLGVSWIHEGKVIIDEAGVEFNNRSYKSFPAEAIYFFKYHRHYRLSIDVFSQSYEDMDVTIRRLARQFYVVKKSLFPGFVVIKKIRRSVGIDDQTHQIIDAYRFGFPILDSKWIFCPPLWKLFNSYSCKNLPAKAWTKW